MGFNLALALGSAVDSYQQTAKNLASIQEARLKRKREEEEYSLKKKELELRIKKEELSGQKTSLELENQKQMANAFFKNQQDINKGKDAMLNQVEQEQATNLRQTSDVISNIMPQVAMAGYAPSMDANGKFSLKSIKQDKWAGYAGTSRRPYDELAVKSHAQKLADIELRQKGINPQGLALKNPEEYGNIITNNIPRAEKTMYGRVLSEQSQGQQEATGGISQQQSIQEGTLAVNKKTGERMVFKGGKWQKI